MTVFYSTELSGITSSPVVKPTAVTAYAARIRRYRGSITLAAQTTSDTIVVAYVPAGDDFAFGMHTTTVTLGSTTVAIGIAGTTGKYRAGATFTATDVPTPFGTALQVAAAALTAEEQIFLTLGAAPLPGSGTYIVDHYFSRP